MKLTIIKGSQALSDFRKNNLIKKANGLINENKIAKISAENVFIIESGIEFSDEDLDKAFNLLETRTLFSSKAEEGFFVIPRLGTVSPWSSKATDIFHNCGLGNVTRVEKAILYKVCDSDSKIFSNKELGAAVKFFYDRMTQNITTDIGNIFQHLKPAVFREIDILKNGRQALEKINIEMGLALSEQEIDYLYNEYKNTYKRNPHDIELLMFGQVNSEHCRHKIFNADWIVDGKKQEDSLFDMIKNTHKEHPEYTLLAYKDNSSIVEGFNDVYFEPDRTGTMEYSFKPAQVDMIMKVETHNHPTAISPYAGASTGVGGEIRDEGATGTGSKTKAGLCGFAVSNLRIPDFTMPWEKDIAGHPGNMATALEIMLDGPIGGASFGNEFGRPQLCGFFKTYEELYNGKHRAYHKPIMLAGGMGNIKRELISKKDILENAYIIQLGGPAMKIGIGGGSASSMNTGSNDAELDFNSVQRDNAEMQRRCQEVIDACIGMGENNPMLSIHDVGAGGLSNACPELVADTGGNFRLRKINIEDSSMSPMEIWCCEAQERYVLAVMPEHLPVFEALCKRERCPFAVLGEALNNGKLIVYDEYFDNKPIDIDVGLILQNPPKLLKDVKHVKEAHKDLDLEKIDLKDACERVLRLPAVANKTFLITITDRTITGMVTRDQMAGPFQVPVSDVAVTSTSLKSYNGEAMAVGERTNIAVLNAPASCRMAIGEAITNICAGSIGEINKVKLSANWMCACGDSVEDMNLYDSVRAVGMELCPALGVSVPVGKDSLSMKAVWKDLENKDHRAISPLSLIVSSFATVSDVRETLTPDLKNIDSVLILIDLGEGKNRLACSAFAQCFNQVGASAPDLDNPEKFKKFFGAVQKMNGLGLIAAYHDRSDGGLFATVSEMAFAGRRGLDVNVSGLGNNIFEILFNEELGAVIQVSVENIAKVKEILKEYGLSGISHEVALLNKTMDLKISFNGKNVYTESIIKLQSIWSELTYRMQSLRDNPECAKQEFDNILDDKNPGMQFKLTYNVNSAPAIITSPSKPKVAILREQGVNGQVEMAAAFTLAGFRAVDVHMTDFFNGRVNLDDFKGLVACGGFSYGDVLGAGAGWAKSILLNPKLKEYFHKFFERKDTFSLGICNGCQMVSQLKDIIPGASHWPRFTKNRSEQFEGRYLSVEILQSPSVLLKGMQGSIVSIPVAHGEGFANFSNTGNYNELKKNNLVSLRFVDNYGKATTVYPYNSNGSIDGVTGLTTSDGRVTIMMPHPERLFRSVQMSYRDLSLFSGDNGPWMKMFYNAREFC